MGRFFTRRRWIAWTAVAASLALHVVMVRWVPIGRESSPAPAPSTTYVELDVEAVASPEPVAPESSPPDARGSAAQREGGQASLRRPAGRTAATRRPAAPPEPPDGTVAVLADDPTNESAETQPEGAAGRARPAVCDILARPERYPGCLPLAAGDGATDTYRVIAPDVVARSAASGAIADGPPDEGARIARALSEDLARTANARAHLSERPPPRLRRQRNGSYRYESAAFDAVIAADGTVTFQDRRGDMGDIGSFTFDVGDELMRASGQDPYVAERRWFLAETRSLRDGLADRARADERRAAMSALEERLRRLWADASQPAAARRRAMFDLWDDCAADAVGRQARSIVERFIRRHLPAESPDAYSARELRALNASRVSPVPFAPYG